MAANPYEALAKSLAGKLAASEAASRTLELRLAEQDACIVTLRTSVKQIETKLGKAKEDQKILVKAVESRDEGVKMLKAQAEYEIRRLQGVVMVMGKRLEGMAGNAGVASSTDQKSGPPLTPQAPEIAQGQQQRAALPEAQKPAIDSWAADATAGRTSPVDQPLAAVETSRQNGQRTLIEITDDDEELPIKSEKPLKRNTPSKLNLAPRHSTKRSLIEADLADLAIDAHSALATPSSDLPAKRLRISKLSNLNTTESFDFKLIQSYSPGPTKRKHIINYFDSSAYASTNPHSNLSELTLAINRLNTEVWERGNEEPWQDVFQQKTIKNRARLCVTAVRAKPARKTKWRGGDVGEFACTFCAAHGLPCFTWAKEEREFRLLPLHEGDRARGVERGFEIRYWVNERD